MDLIDKMLMYAPNKRTKPIYLLGHPFFDELRDKNTKLENGRDLPDLFNFNKVEMTIDQKFIRENLIPDWYKGNQKKNNDYDNENSESENNEKN